MLFVGFSFHDPNSCSPIETGIQLYTRGSSSDDRPGEPANHREAVGIGRSIDGLP